MKFIKFFPESERIFSTSTQDCFSIPSSMYWKVYSSSDGATAIWIRELRPLVCLNNLLSSVSWKPRCISPTNTKIGLFVKLERQMVSRLEIGTCSNILINVWGKKFCTYLSISQGRSNLTRFNTSNGLRLDA